MAKSKKQKAKKKPADSEVKVTADAAVKKKPFNPMEFLQEVLREGRKVTWTTPNEVMISTIMVIVMVLIMSGFFFVVDWALRLIVQFILNLG